MALRLGARVVALDNRGVPTQLLGTVKDSLDMSGLALVEWDDGRCEIHSHSNLVPHGQLKAMFKHGPKLYKRPVKALKRAVD